MEFADSNLAEFPSEFSLDMILKFNMLKCGKGAFGLTDSGCELEMRGRNLFALRSPHGFSSPVYPFTFGKDQLSRTLLGSSVSLGSG